MLEVASQPPLPQGYVSNGCHRCEPSCAAGTWPSRSLATSPGGPYEVLMTTFSVQLPESLLR